MLLNVNRKRNVFEQFFVLALVLYVLEILHKILFACYFP